MAGSGPTAPHVVDMEFHTLQSVEYACVSSPPANAMAHLSGAGQSPAVAHLPAPSPTAGQTVSEIAGRLKRRSVCFCVHATYEPGLLHSHRVKYGTGPL